MLNSLIRCLSTFGLLAMTHAHPHLLERLGRSGNASSDSSPAEALKVLKEGNQRFMQHYKNDHKGLIETLAKGQKPMVSPWCTDNVSTLTTARIHRLRRLPCA
jgi:hypothetical protein